MAAHRTTGALAQVIAFPNSAPAPVVNPRGRLPSSIARMSLEQARRIFMANEALQWRASAAEFAAEVEALEIKLDKARGNLEFHLRMADKRDAEAAGRA